MYAWVVDEDKEDIETVTEESDVWMLDKTEFWTEAIVDNEEGSRREVDRVVLTLMVCVLETLDESKRSISLFIEDLVKRNVIGEERGVDETGV